MEQEDDGIFYSHLLPLGQLKSVVALWSQVMEQQQFHDVQGDGSEVVQFAGMWLLGHSRKSSSWGPSQSPSLPGSD